MHELRGGPIHDREDVAQETILNVLRQESLLRECQQMFKGDQFVAIPFRVKQLMFRLWHQQLTNAVPTYGADLPESLSTRASAFSSSHCVSRLNGIDLPESLSRRANDEADLWLDAFDYVEDAVDEQLINLVQRGFGKQELCSRLGVSPRFLAKWFEQKRTQLRMYSPSAH